MELVKNLGYRELAFRDCEKEHWFRDCCGYNIALLESAFRAFRIYDKKANLYHSVAKVRRTPWISYAPKGREEGRQEWQMQFDNAITEYDFVVDIDNNDELEAYRVARIIKDFFDVFHVPYSINYSGSKGFHFRVADVQIPDWGVLEKLEKYATVAQYLREITGTTTNKTIDSVYDKRRLIRLPYSIDGNTGKVVLPLSDIQFDDFALVDLSPEAVLKNGIGFRGMLTRKGTSTDFLNMYLKCVNK